MSSRDIYQAQRAIYLCSRYISGRLSPAEEEELRQWKEASAANGDLFEKLLDEDYRRLWLARLERHDAETSLQRVKLKMTRDKTRSMWRWYAAASCILILLSAGLYWSYLRMSRQTGTLTGQSLSQDVAPGANRAVLTLEDGTPIYLDDAANGELARQAGMRIRKTDGGQLVYEMAADAGERSPAVYHTMRTPNGGQYTITLPDSTRVWLNAASSLRYPVQFSDKERKVFLTGECYFQVAPDSRRPFIVESDGQEVLALGTAFNINAYSNAASVNTTLIEGKVRVSGKPEAGSALLRPGQQARMNKTIAKLDVRDVNTSEAVAWKNGQFIFRNAELKIIMQQIERWYDVEIDYTQLPDKKFYGKISRAVPLSRVLHMLERSSNLRFTIKERRIMLHTQQ